MSHLPGKRGVLAASRLSYQSALNPVRHRTSSLSGRGPLPIDLKRHSRVQLEKYIAYRRQGASVQTRNVAADDGESPKRESFAQHGGRVGEHTGTGAMPLPDQTAHHLTTARPCNVFLDETDQCASTDWRFSHFPTNMISLFFRLTINQS